MITTGSFELYPSVYAPEQLPRLDDIIELSVTGLQYKITTLDDVKSPSGDVNNMPMRAIRFVKGQFTFPEKFFGLHFARFPTGNPVTVPMDGMSYSIVRSHDKNGLSWASLNPSEGVYFWDTLDSWVEEHHSNDRDMIFTVFGTPTWASARPLESGAYGLGSRSEPLNMSSLTTFITAVSQRYSGKIKFWEVWNEPNNNTFYTGTRSKLVEMAVAIKNVVKYQDSTSKIISPAVTNFSDLPNQSAETYLRDLLATSDGAGGNLTNHIDILGVHLYVPGGDLRKLVGIIENIKSACDANQISNIPIWDTESGIIAPDFSATNKEKRKRLFARQQILSAAMGIEKSCWYGYDYASYGFSNDVDFFNYREWLIKTFSGKVLNSVVIYRNEVHVVCEGVLYKI